MCRPMPLLTCHHPKMLRECNDSWNGPILPPPSLIHDESTERTPTGDRVDLGTTTAGGSRDFEAGCGKRFCFAQLQPQRRSLCDASWCCHDAGWPASCLYIKGTNISRNQVCSDQEAIVYAFNQVHCRHIIV